MDNKNKLISILKEIDPDVDYENEVALVDDGIFDSLEVMSIVVGISDAFHIEIDPNDVVAENFNSVQSILELIQKQL